MNSMPFQMSVENLVQLDPVAAYGMLLHIPWIPVFMNAKASFPTFDVTQPPIKAGLDMTIASRVWIQDIRYRVQQPNVFAGNIQKAQYDAALRQAPGVSVRCQVFSGPRYILSEGFVPLENFGDTIIALYPTGWPLFKQQNIQTEFQLDQAPPSGNDNAPPYNVTVTYRGWQFLDHTLDEMTGTAAANELRKMGYTIPCVPVRGGPGMGGG